MGSVFISHNNADKRRIRFLHEALKKQGHRVRFTSDYEDGYASGTDWAEQIEIEIKSFDLIVFWITKRWLTSPHCLSENYVTRHALSSRRMLYVQEPIL